MGLQQQGGLRGIREEQLQQFKTKRQLSPSEAAPIGKNQPRQQRLVSDQDSNV
jgi:hypothetical protein